MTVMSPLAEQLPALVAGAGYGRREPVIVGVHRQSRVPAFAARGVTGAGEPLSPATLAYTASLSKQITAACAALLVRDGVLDMEAALARWVPGLPAWAATVRLRHLVYHTAALPDAQVDAMMGQTGPAVDAVVGGGADRPGSAVDAVVGGGADRTSPAVLSALARIPALDRRPGTAHAYSGAGYVCLAAAVERAAGQPLSGFARERIFVPLGMTSTRYWPGPAPAPPGAAPLAAPHPPRCPWAMGESGRPPVTCCAGARRSTPMSWASPSSSRRPAPWTAARQSAMRGGRASAPMPGTGCTGTAADGPACARCSLGCRT
jgi:CubicO group peptidase (beta-lactamase class C family)